jgi:hypothetical protein
MAGRPEVDPARGALLREGREAYRVSRQAVLGLAVLAERRRGRSCRRLARCTAALALLCSAACFTVRYQEGAELAHDRVKDITPGNTTRSDVLSWFGAPDTFSDTSMLGNLLEDLEMSPQDALQLPFADALVFRFKKGRLQATILGIWNRMDVRVTADTLVVFFDEQDKVSSYGYRKGTDELETPSE